MNELRTLVRDHTSSDAGAYRLGTQIWYNRKLDTQAFASITLGGVSYHPGDCVIVASEAQSEEPRFARIISIFEDEDDEVSVHLRWFEVGSNTILGETAGPRELFLLTSCDSNPVNCIVAKVKVGFFGDQNSGRYDSVSDTIDHEDFGFYYRHHWNPNSKQFTSASDHESNIYLGLEVSKLTSTMVSDHDVRLKVAIYKRYDDLVPSRGQEHEPGRKFGIRDSRRLFFTGETIKIDGSIVDGVCYVLHRDHVDDLDSFKDQKDTFWVKDRLEEEIDWDSCVRPRDLRPLDSGSVRYSATKFEHEKKMILVREFLERGEKARTLELFNGIGGLTVAFKGISGITNAVEIDPAACVTMRNNQPGVIVHKGDASNLLLRAIKRDQGAKLGKLFDGKGNLIPDLPFRDQVDFIKGGPPCPGYSVANCQKKDGEPKNSLVALYSAYVDFYRPKYSLIENVTGLIHHTLRTPESNDFKTKPETLENGTIRMIYRTYTSMGYQVQCAVLYAEEHGSPQSRPRVIIWATQPGCRLPEYPQPEHLWKTRAACPIFMPGSKLNQSDFHWHRKRRSTPHRVVTLGDAWIDLPEYDIKNPHLIIPQTRFQKFEAEQRRNKITFYDSLDGESYVGSDNQTYASGPKSEYQRIMRKGTTDNVITAHVTRKLTSINTERVCTIPLVTEANHESLPVALKFRSRNSTPVYSPKKCCRLALDGIHNVCMTELEVAGKYGNILHPTQHRIETFDLKNWRVEDAIRGIGNAVPVPLGASLAEGFLDSWMQYIKNRDRIEPRYEEPAARNPVRVVHQEVIVIPDSEDE
ncbi:uncharacterized protein L3040_001501 [Drepanopeziza brunnea f. sp. 'multigermtubi']|uniref:uncharacterized protein n=1 Tax=Drepanopeziza brunnea f. sp. 'multigermtubi' TaxID=698441 RepID=UPI00239A2DF4|nr:hypothetical protein L3040_001501 [Drepanopeziza brunnea f. sp. 'multigermtubi']